VREAVESAIPPKRKAVVREAILWVGAGVGVRQSPHEYLQERTDYAGWQEGRPGPEPGHGVRPVHSLLAGGVPREGRHPAGGEDRSGVTAIQDSAAGTQLRDIEKLT
jgi:hypothetical protein